MRPSRAVWICQQVIEPDAGFIYSYGFRATAHELFLQVAETAVQFFITADRPNVSGLVLAGSADFKTELSQSDMFDQRLQAVILSVVDVSYGTHSHPCLMLRGTCSHHWVSSPVATACFPCPTCACLVLGGRATVRIFISHLLS